MAEHLFTIFEGPDAGMQFVVRDAPVRIGREAGQDVELHDDRTSRLHATLRPEGEAVILTDEESSNGTFLNGNLVERAEVKPGDVIQISNTCIVFGTDPPTRERMAVIKGIRTAHEFRAAGIGSATQVMDSASTPPSLSLERFRPIEIIEVVIESAKEKAEAAGVHVAAETGTETPASLQVTMDRNLLYRSLAELASMLIEKLPASEGTLALRHRLDPATGGGVIQFLAVAIPFDRNALESCRRTPAFAQIVHDLHRNAAVLEFLPAAMPDVLACVHLPPDERGFQKTVVL